MPRTEQRAIPHVDLADVLKPGWFPHAIERVKVIYRGGIAAFVVKVRAFIPDITAIFASGHAFSLRIHRISALSIAQKASMGSMPLVSSCLDWSICCNSCSRSRTQPHWSHSRNRGTFIWGTEGE